MSAKRRRRQWARMGTRGRRGAQRIDNGFLEAMVTPHPVFAARDAAIQQELREMLHAKPVDAGPNEELNLPRFGTWSWENEGDCD